MNTPSEDLSADSTAERAITTSKNRAGRMVPNLNVQGYDESEILAMAPALVCDRVHWDTTEPVSTADIVKEFPGVAYTRCWSDGQHRVWVEKGTGQQAREFINEWCTSRGIEPFNLRVETAVPFRDVDAIPHGLFGDLVLAAVDWLYPRTYAIRRRLVTDLELVDDDDIRSMMFLFISDHADRYDADRLGRNGTLNFLAFMFGKMRTWPQDAARSLYGRNAVDDQVQFRKVNDAFLAETHREATDDELAQSTQSSVQDIRKRKQAISTVRSLRNIHSLDAEPDDSRGVTSAAARLADSVDVADEATTFAQSVLLTKAVVHGCHYRSEKTDRVHSDPLALACIYLTFWGEHTRQSAATELGVLPKTVSTAVSRVVGRLGDSLAPGLVIDVNPT